MELSAEENLCPVWRPDISIVNGETKLRLILYIVKVQKLYIITVESKTGDKIYLIKPNRLNLEKKLANNVQNPELPYTNKRHPGNLAYDLRHLYSKPS
jgi:hypothetical protein